MKKLLTLSVLLLSFSTYSQSIFKSGYFIKNNNEKIECLIKSTGKIHNPESITYKFGPDSELRTISATEIKEFEITGTDQKYKTLIVDIDKSTFSKSDSNSDRNPDFKRDTLLLKVLIEGKGSLYSYSSNAISEKFFYSIDNSDAQALIYKKYTVNDKIKENNRYLQQINNQLECIEDANIMGKEYKASALSSLFIEYNECTNSEYINYYSKKDSGTFNFSVFLTAGLRNWRFGQKDPTNHTGEINSVFSPGIRAEVEYIFPFFNSKFGLVAQPGLEYLQGEGELVIFNTSRLSSNPNAYGGERAFLSFDYLLATIPVGLRYYVYQNSTSKFFADGLFNISYAVSEKYDTSNFNSETALDSMKKNPIATLKLGAGWKFKDKFILGIGYSPTNNIASEKKNEVIFKNSFDISFGYSF